MTAILQRLSDAVEQWPTFPHFSKTALGVPSIPMENMTCSRGSNSLRAEPSLTASKGPVQMHGPALQPTMQE